MAANPNLFPEPEKFNPDRFEIFDADSSDTKGENVIPYHAIIIVNITHLTIFKYSYLPFGMGQRQCIGRSFAILELLIVVGSVLKNLNVEQTPITIKSIAFKIVTNICLHEAKISRSHLE